jgi:DNA-binding CsgD family transcriptional regulator
VDTDGKRLFIARENVGLLAKDRALSQREQQVLALIAAGRSNKLIAYELGVSPSTVSLHVQSILAKTGARDRAKLVDFAMTLFARWGVTSLAAMNGASVVDPTNSLRARMRQLC